MIRQRFLHPLVLVCAFCSAPASHAQTETLTQYVNASTCDYNAPPGVFIIVGGHFLAARNDIVYCSIPQPFTRLGTESSLQLLSVLYEGMNTGGGGVTARLCVFDSTARVVVVDCSPPQASTVPARFADVVTAPAREQVTGAYVSFTFSDQAISFIYQMQPFWRRTVAAAASAVPPEPLLRKAGIDPKADERTAAYLSRLAAAVQQESRSDAWAAKEESRLRGSFLATGLDPGSLKTVDCRSTNCQLELQPSADPVQGAHQQLVVGKWLSATAPCAYTMAWPAVAAGEQPAPARVYVTCGK